MIKKKINDYYSFHKVITEDFDKFFTRVSFSSDTDYLNSDQMKSLFMLLCHHKILKDNSKYFDKELKEIVKMQEEKEHPFNPNDNDIEEDKTTLKQVIKRIEAEKEKENEDIKRGCKSYIKFSDLIHLDSEETGGKTRYYNKLKGLTEYKEVLKPGENAINNLFYLGMEMPNFNNIIKDVQNMVITHQLLDTDFKLPNILINGNPGIGKTRFIKKLVDALHLERFFISMGGNSDSLKIKGLSRGWSSAKPGEITLNLASSKSFNPVFCIDEIDKTVNDRKDALHDIPSVFLSYLEEETNKNITDDYIGKDLDMSQVQYIFTSNSIKDLPDYFLSRVHVYNVKDYTQDQQYEVIKNIFNELNSKYKNYIKSIDDEAIYQFIKLDNMREIKRIVEMSIIKAIANKETILNLTHIDINKDEVIKNSIGFL